MKLLVSVCCEFPIFETLAINCWYVCSMHEKLLCKIDCFQLEASYIAIACG